MATKSELIERLSQKFTQLEQHDIDLAVRIVLNTMIQALSKGYRIEIRGFGSFVTSQRLPRIGRNPKSGELVSIPQKSVPHFKAGKQLRQRVNH